MRIQRQRCFTTTNESPKVGAWGELGRNTMGNINWGHLLFSFSGRINRAKWWLTVLVSIIISVVAAIIAAVVGENAGNIVSLIAFIPQIWIGLAAGAKRLHDLNRTAVWLVFFYLAPVVLIIIFF